MINSIIVATGLSKRFISREPSFQNSRDHIGRRATDALMGSSDSSGSGPLPILLESAKKNGVPIFSCSFGSDQFDHTSDSLPPDVREFVDERNSILIPPGDSLPTDTIVKGLCRAIEIDRSDLRDRLATLKVVVLGCHTEVAVFQLAQFFRSVIGIKQVSICSHTVASNSNEAHFAMLRHNFPRIGVLVHLDLNDSMSFLGLSHEDTSRFGPCEVEPDTLREAITADQLRLIQMLCLNWTKSTMRPLTGGFSGSLLLLAQGWRGNAKTEPMVVKIDSFKQMRRELLGYYQVKDLLGKNVPTFGYPVDSNELIGVGMELAAMEGTPQTLQDAFEEADHELSLQNFLDRLAKSLDLLSTKLYSNTRQAKWIAPYRKFGLHAQQQLNWLKENSYQLSKYLEEEDSELGRLNIDQVVNLVKVAARNEDGYQSDVCVSHGDLNLANIISDGIDNVWFIDWTHCSEQPLELDFAKLENDIKFVISKDFDLEDASRLAALEEYLIETPIPPEANGLPDRLRFAKWDLRF